MKYRRYGKTNLEISALTFGAMRIPFDEESCTAEERARGEANAVATVRRARELGINHIDTAAGYGNSERLLGLAFSELGRGDFVITTKTPIRPSRDDTRRVIDRSLERMGIDRIDVLDLHGVNTPDKLKTATDRNGCFKAVEEALDEGIVANVAFSSHAGPDVIIPTMETGLFSAMSLLFWWTYPRNAPAVARAAELGIGVLILSPAEKGGLLFAPPSELERVCLPFSPLVLSHRWALAQTGVTTLAIGAATPEQFDAHLPAADTPDTLTAEELTALDRWLAFERTKLGGTRCAVCFECMPCPENVAIPEILRLRNLARAFDMTDFGRMRYNLLGHGDDWFPGLKADACTRCGKCLPECPEGLDIPELLYDTHEILLGEERKRLWDNSA